MESAANPYNPILSANAAPAGSGGAEVYNPAHQERNRKIRLSLDVTQEMKQVLDELAEKSGRTQSEILRTAIALYRAVNLNKEEGTSVALVDERNQVKTKFVGI